MVESTIQENNPPSVTGSQDSPATQSNATLQDVLDTMHDSDVFPRIGKDTTSRFWSAYERVAKQHDDEFLERHSSDMDVLLIFAGLFSAVSAAFIVSMENSLIPNPNDTTNALLKILINKIDNNTFSQQEASLPIWIGPSSTEIWIQTLAYTSLSTSLFAAFGTVLAKQWLGYFKTSRFGRGSLDERCKRRQRKLDGLHSWHFNTIIASLPVFLQLSLLFFGIALSANIWTQQHTVASVIIGTTSLGFVFYTFTVVASLRFPDCPFQTPVSTVLEHVRLSVAPMYTQESWTGLLNGLQSSLRNASKAGTGFITRSLSSCQVYLSGVIWTTRLRTTQPQRTQLRPDSPETGSEASAQSKPESKYEEIELKALSPLDEPIGARSIEWILETSTDTDMVTAAARMVLEVEWPDQYNVGGVLDRLKNHLDACFDSTRQLLPLAQARAVACLKAIYHMCFQRGLNTEMSIRYRGIDSTERHLLYQIPRNQDFLLISCAADEFNDLNVTSLPYSDRMWMAHILTYRLRQGVFRPTLEDFVIRFISICLLDSNSPPRLIADCWLLAGQLIGQQINRRHLARIDKSAIIQELRDLVMKRMFDVLLDEDEDSIYSIHTVNASQLLQPLRQYLDEYVDGGPYDRDISIRCLKRGFHFLEQDYISMNRVQSNNVATMLRLSLFYSPLRNTDQQFVTQFGPEPERWYWRENLNWHTPAQFDLLVGYLVRVCEEGTDYVAICDAFVVLGGLRDSPSTLELTRTYIGTTMRFMGLETPIYTRHAALIAASVVRTKVALMGREDESFRNCFSQALVSAVLGCDPISQQQASTQLDNSPFKDPSFFSLGRDLCYLKLLSTLSHEPSWHHQLQRDGHFDNCLAIADTASSQNGFGAYAAHVTDIFAIIDTLGEDQNQFFKAVQAYPSWPLILKAWHYIFSFRFFRKGAKRSWESVATTGDLEALPSLLAYAKRYWERWDNTEETDRLIKLVEQVCIKLEGQTHQTQQGDARLDHGQDGTSFSHRETQDLCNDIRGLLRGKHVVHWWSSGQDST